MMLYLLVTIVALFFFAHVVLLLASFRTSGFSDKRYFYSHLSLWLTGVTVFWLAWDFHNIHGSGFLDYFSTLTRLYLILVFTAALSLLAHLLVRYLVLPLWRKQ